MLIVNPSSASTAEPAASIETAAARGGTAIAATASTGLATLSLLGSDHRVNQG